ncbi:hypothetical protein FO519_009308 [Halicephalobus sp. NKZ332]|nr:hypothetical protein FO519_009308 [Halicephalobus sp. NKZ332]
MDLNVKKELNDQLIQLKIENDDSSIMPFEIVNAVLEVPSAFKVDIQQEGVEISNSTEIPVVNFEHTPNKSYSVILDQYRSKVIFHDIRQKGLDYEGEEIEIASFDLVLTFSDGVQMTDFVSELKNCGYQAKPKNKQF